MVERSRSWEMSVESIRKHEESLRNALEAELAEVKRERDDARAEAQGWREQRDREYELRVAVVRELGDALREAVEAKNAAYAERNKLVALLARLYPSGIRRTAIEGWEPEWHGCVYIDSPVGQLSWHYHDSEAHLFAGLPPYEKDWDGHTTDEKYARIDALARHLATLAGRERGRGAAGQQV